MVAKVMAYRQPDRRESLGTGQATSYLEDFLDQIEGLPNSIRSICNQIRQLDDRSSSTVQEADAVAKEAVSRATTKGVPLENVKRTYHDFIHLQASVTEFAEKKARLATDARDKIDTVLADLDARLVEFEAQLRKEGRWPSAEHPSRPAKAPRSKAPITTNAEKTANRATQSEPSQSRTTQKARRRDSGHVVIANPTTPRAAALAAARAAEADAAAAKAEAEAEADAASEAAQVAEDSSGDVVMEPVDQSALDNTLYCTCRKVSQGQMVACEGKNCAIEWFHFECVGLKEEPEGAWYCKDCSAAMRRKSSTGRRKGS